MPRSECPKNRTIGFSANFLCYGREVNTPLDLIMCDSQQHSPPARPNQHARTNFRQILRKVAHILDATYEKGDNAHNTRLDTPFKAGEQCLIRVRCPKHKFATRYYGTIKIKKAINDTVYAFDLNRTEKLVNISKLNDGMVATRSRVPVSILTHHPFYMFFLPLNTSSPPPTTPS